MKKSLLIPLTASILLSTSVVGVSEVVNPTSVEAAKKTAVLKKKAYIYTVRGVKTKKYLKKGKRISYTSTKKIKGHKYLKLSKNRYIRVSNIQTSKSKKSVKITESYPVKKNAADLMNYLANSTSLTNAQKSEATKAEQLLKTGTVDGQVAPNWFNRVSLTDKNDATSAKNIKTAVSYMNKANAARKNNGVDELKVSPVLTAIAIIDSDYQQQGGLEHPSYYSRGLENLSAGADPIQMWLSEKSNWQYDVKKNSNLSKYEFTPDWGNSEYSNAVMGQNGYKTAGHYLNLLNSTHTVMGFGHLSTGSYGSADAFIGDDSNSDAGIPVNQFESLVNTWLKEK